MKELKTVKQLFEESGLKAKDFAAKYHIAPPTLNRWITSKGPTDDRLWMLNTIIEHDLGEKAKYEYFRRTAKITWANRSRIKEGCTDGEESLSTGEAYCSRELAETWITHKRTKVEEVSTAKGIVFIVTEYVCIDTESGKPIAYSRMAIPVGSRMDRSPVIVDSLDKAEKALAKMQKDDPDGKYEIIWDWMA